MSGPRKRRCVCLLFSSGVLLLVLGGIMIPVVNMVIKDKIKEKVIISNTSELWDIWCDPPDPIYMQFYMFNLSNPMEVKNGERPYVIQKGPYTYRERRKKYDIVFNQNGTVTYRQNRTFFFLRNMSAGAESDVFVTVNPVVLGVVSALHFAPTSLRKVVNFALEVAGEDIFMIRSVKDLIWGYTDPVLKTLNKLLPRWFYTDVVGYFTNKNDTDDGLYTVVTGSKDISSLGQIDMYNGSKFLPFWSTEWANMVNGSDGTLSPPFSQEAQQLAIFSSDMCRSGNAFYKYDVKTKQDISLRRFSGTASELANATANPDNLGFCTPQTNCLPSGLLNISNCVIEDHIHIPVSMSLPHFFMADPRVIRSVGGLNPNEEEHGTTVDVEPWTGLVLQAAKRIQINMYLTQLRNFSLTKKVRTLFMPVFWLNESAVVDDKHAAMLKRELFVPLEIVSALEKTLMVIGGVLILVAVAFAAYGYYKKTHAKGTQRETLLRRGLDPPVHVSPPPADSGHTPEADVTSAEPTCQAADA